MKAVYLVEGKRIPQVKSGMDIKDVPAPFLATGIVRYLMDKHGIPADQVDEVVFGNTGTPAKYPNIGRVIALEAGLHKKTNAYSVHRNCASGMEALSQAYVKIASGRCDVMIAGGVESMSQMPLIYNKDMTDLFINLMKAKTTKDKLRAMAQFRPHYLSPVVAIEVGLTDPFCGLNMGQTAEILARELKISRQDQDEFALRSHQKAIEAINSQKMAEEIVPLIFGNKLDKLLDKDVGPRDNLSMESLAKLKPYFEKETGTVTVGNACPITDGASAFLLASEEAVKKYNLKPVARLVDFHFHGLEPERMGLGPVMAIHGVLKRTGMKLDQIDLFELNEAFAAQVIGCLKVMKDKNLSSRWGIEEVIGEIPMEKLNVNGGAIALGHPVGSTGSRLAVTLTHELKRRKAKYGLASLCIGGGQGGALIVENLI
jgi:acetyl-CoA C-acetyltransferase